MLDVCLGRLKMADMYLTDVKLTDQVFRHEIDGHEIGGHDIYRLIINYSAVCNSFFKTTAEHKSQQQSKSYNMHMYNMLKCIKCNENINLKLATGEQ